MYLFGSGWGFKGMCKCKSSVICAINIDGLYIQRYIYIMPKIFKSICVCVFIMVSSSLLFLLLLLRPGVCGHLYSIPVGTSDTYLSIS